MLLRSVTEHVKSQNWFAVGLDFVIVVVGVFVGLQVQEWSIDRAERRAEYDAIERLIVEYQQNLEILAKDKEKSHRTMVATERLLSMISPNPEPVIVDKAIAQTFLDCLSNAKFVPTLGTTNSLVASGDIRLIRDPDLQRMLTQWPATAQVLFEWQEIERNHGEELILGLTYEYLAWPTLDSAIGGSSRTSALKSDFKGLFSSKRFEGLLHNRWYNTRASIGRIEELEAETRKLTDRLAARLSEIDSL